MSFSAIPQELVIEEILPSLPFLQIYNMRDRQPNLYRREIQRRATTIDPYLVAIVSHDVDLVQRLLNASNNVYQFPLSDLVITAIRARSYDIAEKIIENAPINDPNLDAFHRDYDKILTGDELLDLLVFAPSLLADLAYNSVYFQREADMYQEVYNKYGRDALQRLMDFAGETKNIDDIIATLS